MIFIDRSLLIVAQKFGRMAPYRFPPVSGVGRGALLSMRD